MRQRSLYTTYERVLLLLASVLLLAPLAYVLWIFVSVLYLGASE